jgi:hypothetical protein
VEYFEISVLLRKWKTCIYLIIQSYVVSFIGKLQVSFFKNNFLKFGSYLLGYYSVFKYLA